eukprot:Pgem_evm1s9068
MPESIYLNTYELNALPMEDLLSIAKQNKFKNSGKKVDLIRILDKKKISFNNLISKASLSKIMKVYGVTAKSAHSKDDMWNEVTKMRKKNLNSKISTIHKKDKFVGTKGVKQSNKTKNLKSDILTQRVYEVANVYLSANDKKNWKQQWIKGTGKSWPKLCQINACKDEATKGGHMHVRVGIGRDRAHNNEAYILPICTSHNNNKRLDCGVDKCAKFAHTKPSAVLLRVDTVNIAQARKYDLKHQAAVKGKFSGGRVKRVKDSKEVSNIMAGKSGPCEVMFTMNNCIHCTTASNSFRRDANDKRHIKYYNINIDDFKGNMCNLIEKKYAPKGFPTFWKYSEPRKKMVCSER